MDKKKIKILYLIARLNIGGPAINVIYLTSLLDKQKFTPILVSGVESPEEGNMFNLAHKMNVEPIVIPELGREIDFVKDFVSLLKLIRIIFKFKPDIIHTHTAKAGAIGRIAALLTFVPIKVHTFHGHIFNGYFSKLKTRVFLGIERFLSYFTNKIISVSNHQRKEFYDLKLGNKDKIINIPLGLDFSIFKNLEKKKNIVRDEFNISDDVILLGIVARLVPIKNHFMAFEALEILWNRDENKYKNLKLLVVGDGCSKDELEYWVNYNKFNDNIIFYGFTNDLVKIYAALDLCLLTSLNEGLPTVIIESQYCKVPVIATDVGGIPDLIDDKKTGLLCKTHNPEDLADIIVDLIENKKLMNDIKENAYNNVKEKYSVETMIKTVEKFYESSCI